MKATDAVKEVMKRLGVTQTALAKRTGTAQPTVAMRLNQDNLSILKLNEMLRVMDYKVVIMPASATTPKDGIEIE